MTEETVPADQLNRILNAVDTIESSLGILARKQSLSREAYRTDSDSRDIVERRFVKMTEAAIDIGEELVKHERSSPPRSNPESMRALGELGILSNSTAEEMVRVLSFGTSYTYGDIIDHDVVYNALQDLERYRQFVLEVRDYLESTGSLEE